MRLGALTSDVNVKMLERPTINYFKKVLSVYDEKIETFKVGVNIEVDNI